MGAQGVQEARSRAVHARVQHVVTVRQLRPRQEQTAAALSEFIRQARQNPAGQSGPYSARVTAWPVPSVASTISRPSTWAYPIAMTPLQNEVGQARIALWLGHESVATTCIHLHADLKLKEQEMATTAPFEIPVQGHQSEDKVLEFLNGKCSFRKVHSQVPHWRSN